MLACVPVKAADAYRTIRCVASALQAVSTASSGPTAALWAFRSSSVPQIALADYAVHIAARCSHGEEAVLIGLVLMARYCRTVNQMPTAYTEHRLLLAAIVVGSKAHYDDFYKNVYMARIGGVGTKELAQLELHFIMNIKGSLVVSPREMARFRSTFEGLGAAITDATTPEAKASARSQAQRLGTYLMLEEVTAAHDYSSIVSAKVIKTAITPLNQAQACGAVGDAMGPASQSSPLVTRCSSSTVPIKLRTLVAELSVSDNLAVGSSVTPLFASSSLARSGAFD